MSNKIDMTNKIFGNLLVVRENGKVRNEAGWLCKCKNCGRDITLPGYRLRDGTYTSCGKCISIGDKVKKHGMYKARFYHIWENMKQRCLNANSVNYKNYGGRGINICSDWLVFENFKQDMYDSYLKHIEEYGEDQTSIDRINNNGNYELNNCQWATRSEQQSNRRRYTKWK